MAGYGAIAWQSIIIRDASPTPVFVDTREKRFLAVTNDAQFRVVIWYLGNQNKISRTQPALRIFVSESQDIGITGHGHFGRRNASDLHSSAIPLRMRTRLAFNRPGK